MREDAPSGSREPIGMPVGFGTQVPGSGVRAGPVVQGADLAAGGLVLVVWEVGEPARPNREPALGVMGGLQTFSLPPVSSALSASFPRTRSGPTGSNQNPATPAPNSIPDQPTKPRGTHRAAGQWNAPERGPDVLPGEVSPLRTAVPAAPDVVPTGRQTAGADRVNRFGDLTD